MGYRLWLACACTKQRCRHASCAPARTNFAEAAFIFTPRPGPGDSLQAAGAPSQRGFLGSRPRLLRKTAWGDVDPSVDRSRLPTEERASGGSFGALAPEVLLPSEQAILELLRLTEELFFRAQVVCGRFSPSDLRSHRASRGSGCSLLLYVEGIRLLLCWVRYDRHAWGDTVVPPATVSSVLRDPEVVRVFSRLLRRLSRSGAANQLGIVPSSSPWEH